MSNQKEPAGNGRRIIIIAAFVVLLVALAVCIVLLLSKKEVSNDSPVAETRQRSEAERALERGFVSEDSADDIMEEMANKVADGMFECEMTMSWTFQDGKSVASNAYVANSENNLHTLYFDVYDNSTDELLYSSPMMPVGTTPASADETTTAADLGNVTMTGATGASVPLGAGDNELQFVLGKATYTPISGSEVTLGTTNGNNVASNYELTGLAADGKGITAFTLTGSMNKTAEWHKLTGGIKITPTYTLETVADTAVSNVKSGTGAVYANPIPQFTTGAAVGTINYTNGTGNDALKTITKVEMTMPNGNTFNGYAGATGKWGAAKDENGTITLQAAYLKFYQDGFPSDSTVEATVTYTTQNDEEKSATVDVKLR